MNDSMHADFLVIVTVLRTMYQNIVTKQLTPSTINEAVEILITLANQLYRLLGHSIRQATNSDAEESVEELIVLFWQITWVLNKQDIDVISIRTVLQKLQVHLQNLPEQDENGFLFLPYDSLATEIILAELSHFMSDILWCESFVELNEATQNKLRKIDQQILNFSQLVFPNEEKRLQQLLQVFFDCYLGFQQRQHDNTIDPYEGLVRESWQRRFRKYKTYQPTKMKILCTYSAGLDFSVRLNTYWLSKVMEKAVHAEGKSTPLLVRELGEFLQNLEDLRTVQIPGSLLQQAVAYIDNRTTGTTSDERLVKQLVNRLNTLVQAGNMPDTIRTPSELLQVLLGYIKIVNSGKEWPSKVDIQHEAVEDMWDLIDFMNEITRDAAANQSLGGAAATGADALVKLGESQVYLLIPFAPANFLERLPQAIKILWYAPGPVLEEYNPLRLKTHLADVQHPEVRNFIIEFSSGEPITYCACCGAGVVPRKTDRVIVRNRFAYYRLDGNVDRGLTQHFATQLKVLGFFGFDSSITHRLSFEQRKSLARQAREKAYDVLFAAGIQNLEKNVHDEVEEALQEFYAGGTKIHVEISGTKNLTWLTHLLQAEYVFSVGVGEELEALFHVVKKLTIASRETESAQTQEQKRVEKFESGLQNCPHGYRKAMLALETAHLLGLPRFYVHDIDIDIIVRQGKLSKKERFQEIQADLIAKWVVLRKLMTRGQISNSLVRDTMTQVKEEGFAVLMETARLLHQKMKISPSGTTELYGMYFPDYDRTLIWVPVRWVYGTMQDQLRVIGAGDTTSLVSATQAIARLKTEST